MNEYGMEDALYEALLEGRRGQHPERYILGKPHPDRAKQFKPFAALRGYDETVKAMALELNAKREKEGPASCRPFREACGEAGRLSPPCAADARPPA